MLLESENVYSCRFNIPFNQVVINRHLVVLKIINTIIQYFIVISGDSVNFELRAIDNKFEFNYEKL